MKDAAMPQSKRQAEGNALAAWSITRIGPLEKKMRKTIARYGRIA
jgi:hypothetical protein